MKKVTKVLLFTALCATLVGAITACKTDPEYKAYADYMESLGADALSQKEYETFDGRFIYGLKPDGTLLVADASLLVGEADKTLTELTIPASFLGKTVTEVAAESFAELPALTKITLPASIKAIGAGAFADCEKLATVYSGESEGFVLVLNNAYAGGLNAKIGAGAFANSALPAITIEDSHDGDTTVSYSLDKLPDGVEEISIDAALNSATDLVAENTVLAEDEEGTLDFGTYGLFKHIGITVKGGQNKTLAEFVGGGVAVSAEHYNFAFMNASYPVLVYSLSLKNILATGPSFVALERASAYDWTNLPEGLSRMPYMTEEEATTPFVFNELRPGLQAYIGELYEINDESTFTLHITDNYVELILEMLVANKIPDAQWNAVLLSDGSGSASIINQAFAVDDPYGRYAEMAANWEVIKAYVEDNGYSNGEVYNRTLYPYTTTHYSILARYAYVVAKEQENVEWIVNRFRATENLSATNEKSPEFVAELCASVTEVNTNNLLTALSAEEAEAFKALYKFNGDMFEVAEQNGKKIMVILGTSRSGEAGVFYDYVRLTMDFYGDEYEYYYKGHPGWPTSAAPERQDALEALAAEGYVLHELDNAIAAEIILFFKPDIYVSGWSSTTFQAVEEARMAAAVYATTKAGAASLPYVDLLDKFFSKIAPMSSEYEGITLNMTHNYYLIEYNNKDADQLVEYNKHEIAIYDATAHTITYYKMQSGAYVAVEA